MVERIRLIIDFWNFQLNWNQRAGGARCDWTRLPSRILEGISELDPPRALSFDGTRVFASVDDSNPSEENLRQWLSDFLDLQPGFNVEVLERHQHLRAIHCKSCGSDLEACPRCGAQLRKAAEKGVDAAIVTHMFALAWERAADVIVLVSSDRDFIPAVEYLQTKGHRVVNVRWKGLGDDLAKACWSSLLCDSWISDLTRAERE